MSRSASARVPELRARRGREWLDRLDAEHANLRACARPPAGSGDADGALRLSGAIWLYWQTRGHWTEGRRFLAAAVALGGDLEPELLVDALWGAALLALWQGDIAEGEQLASRIARDLAHSRWKRSRFGGDHTCLRSSRPSGEIATERLALLEESLALGRRGGDPWLLSVALNNLGDLLMQEGDYERAIALFEESLAIGEARGDLDRRARALVTSASRPTASVTSPARATSTAAGSPPARDRPGRIRARRPARYRRVRGRERRRPRRHTRRGFSAIKRLPGRAYACPPTTTQSNSEPLRFCVPLSEPTGSRTSSPQARPCRTTMRSASRSQRVRSRCGDDAHVGHAGVVFAVVANDAFLAFSNDRIPVSADVEGQ